jgi:LEA14-like dessication related protein
MAVLLVSGLSCKQIIKKQFKEPEIRGVFIRVSDHASGEETMNLPLLLSLSVFNPNSYSIKARSLIYTVKSRDTVIGQGIMETLPPISPETTTTVEIPLVISILPLLESVSHMIGGKYVALTVFGSITLHAVVEDIHIPFRKELKKDLRRFFLR